MNKPWMRVVVALLVLQCVLVALYFALERQPERERKELTYVTTQRIESVDVPVEPFAVERRDGSSETIEPARGVMVHFWATWCPSCVDELPQLLREARNRDVEVVAVSLDDDWKTLETFFDGEVPPEVVRPAESKLAQRLGVVDLPQTIIHVRGGPARRFVGPRDWTSTFETLEFE